MKISSAILMVGLSFATAGIAESVSSGSSAAARSYLSRLSAQSSLPGVSAAVMVKGEIVFSCGVGLAILESQEPQTGSIVHNIDSISKTQAVVAVLQLVEKGKRRRHPNIR